MQNTITIKDLRALKHLTLGAEVLADLERAGLAILVRNGDGTISLFDPVLASSCLDLEESRESTGGR